MSLYDRLLGGANDPDLDAVLNALRLLKNNPISNEAQKALLAIFSEEKSS